jgi:hypothetical protein
LIVALRVTSSTPIVEKSFNEIFPKLDKKTLGCLLKEVSTFTEIVDGTLDRLMSLLKMRNYLVHHYWVNNSTKSLTGAGRKSILDELNEIVQNFKDGDNLVVGIYTPLWAKLGANEDTVKQELEKLKAE